MCNISVIIPAYNAEAYLPDAVASVLKQPYRNIHVIIVDDGSTDRTATLCDEMAVADSRITVLHQKMQVYHAREMQVLTMRLHTWSIPPDTLAFVMQTTYGNPVA